MGVESTTSSTTPLSEAVSSYMTTLNKSVDAQTNALSRQNDVQNILNNETVRLNNKKAAIDNAMKAQGRIIFFNDNSRKWYAAYLRIILAIVLILAIIFGLKLINDNFSNFIPLWILQLAFVFAFSIGVIYIFLVYAAAARHSRYNYDELKMAAPDTTPLDDAAAAAKKAADDAAKLLGQSCVDDSCCDVGTYWNPAVGKCLPGAAPPASAAGGPAVLQAFTTLDNISPQEASEYNEYSAYK